MVPVGTTGQGLLLVKDLQLVRKQGPTATFRRFVFCQSSMQSQREWPRCWPLLMLSMRACSSALARRHLCGARRERGEVWRCSQFAVEQGGNIGAKVGTDAMLLGSWACVVGAQQPVQRRAVDIGTGTGILALMLAQAYPHLHIDAVEIEPAAAAQARLNVENSPFFDRVRVHEGAVQRWVAIHESVHGSMQLVVSNPPFFAPLPAQRFIVPAGGDSREQARRAARSTAELPHAGWACCNWHASIFF